MIPVCMFAKPPRAGEVKTRLIPALGVDAATCLAAAMLRDVWQVVAECPGVRPVLATTEPGAFPVRVPQEDIWLQGDGDLGSRIERILSRGLKFSRAAIALGADTPALTQSHLQQAITALATYDAAIGVCSDGGFYLLALKSCPDKLFANLPWSASHTAEAVLRRLHQHTLSVAKLAPLFDVDSLEDLSRLKDFLRRFPSQAPATRNCLEKFECVSASSFRP